MKKKTKEYLFGEPQQTLFNTSKNTPNKSQHSSNTLLPRKSNKSQTRVQTFSQQESTLVWGETKKWGAQKRGTRLTLFKHESILLSESTLVKHFATTQVKQEEQTRGQNLFNKN